MEFPLDTAGATVSFSAVFGYSTVIIKLLFLGYAFPGRLPERYHAFITADFCSWHQVVSLHFLQFQVRDIGGKKKTWRTHPFVFPGVLSSLTGLSYSLQLSEFLGLFCVSFPELLIVPKGGKRKVCLVHLPRRRNLFTMTWNICPFLLPSCECYPLVPAWPLEWSQTNSSSPWQPFGY